LSQGAKCVCAVAWVPERYWADPAEGPKGRKGLDPHPATPPSPTHPPKIFLGEYSL
jgi:hypothetical protein